jgi:hypothetical protein
LEQNLQPGEQMWMDIGKLIRENVPDKTGKTLPSDLTTGSYEFRDLTNKGVGSLFEGKIIYDKTYGHVTYGCALCCGWSIPTPLWYDPISVIITSFQDDGVYAWYPCENQYDDVSTAFYNGWSSGAPSVVTVDSYGTHHGVAVGSTTSQTFGVLQSNNVHLMCPTHGYTPSGSANVQPCATPTSETTTVAMTAYTTETAFNQLISDTAGHSFNLAMVQEGNAAPGQDTCYGTWSIGSQYTGIPPNPPWTVDWGQVQGQPNHWGFDVVGWSQTAVDYYRVQAPAHGVPIPCGLTGYQSMQIQCPNGTWLTYTPSVGNKLTATIEQTYVINCRYDMNNSACQTINY